MDTLYTKLNYFYEANDFNKIIVIVAIIIIGSFIMKKVYEILE